MFGVDFGDRSRSNVATASNPTTEWIGVSRQIFDRNRDHVEAVPFYSLGNSVRPLRAQNRFRLLRSRSLGHLSALKLRPRWLWSKFPKVDRLENPAVASHPLRLRRRFEMARRTPDYRRQSRGLPTRPEVAFHLRSVICWLIPIRTPQSAPFIEQPIDIHSKTCVGESAERDTRGACAPQNLFEQRRSKGLDIARPVQQTVSSFLEDEAVTVNRYSHGALSPCYAEKAATPSRAPRQSSPRRVRPVTDEAATT